LHFGDVTRRHTDRDAGDLRGDGGFSNAVALDSEADAVVGFGGRIVERHGQHDHRPRRAYGHVAP
jgi:hypothetical protein